MKNTAIMTTLSWICTIILIVLRSNDAIIPQYCAFIDKAIPLFTFLSGTSTLLLILELVNLRRVISKE
jgi:hypothetical protein